MTRNSFEDAPDAQAFNQLLDATEQLPEPRDVETEFVLQLGGRLGLRGGEIAHLTNEWVDWKRKVIQIPEYDECTKGRDGGVCGYCKKRAREAAELDPDTTYEEALAARWEPKTRAGARAVPFDFDDDVLETVERFFFHYDEYPKSRVSVNRRVSDAAEAAGLPPGTVYPHALRASAVTHHAYRGLPLPAMLSLFGWSDVSTARKYIRVSGEQTRQAVHEAFGTGRYAGPGS